MNLSPRKLSSYVSPSFSLPYLREHLRNLAFGSQAFTTLPQFLQTSKALVNMRTVRSSRMWYRVDQCAFVRDHSALHFPTTSNCEGFISLPDQ